MDTYCHPDGEDDLGGNIGPCEDDLGETVWPGEDDLGESVCHHLEDCLGRFADHDARS